MSDESHAAYIERHEDKYKQADSVTITDLYQKQDSFQTISDLQDQSIIIVFKYSFGGKLTTNRQNDQPIRGHHRHHL